MIYKYIFLLFLVLAILTSCSKKITVGVSSYADPQALPNGFKKDKYNSFHIVNNRDGNELLGKEIALEDQKICGHFRVQCLFSISRRSTSSLIFFASFTYKKTNKDVVWNFPVYIPGLNPSTQQDLAIIHMELIQAIFLVHQQPLERFLLFQEFTIKIHLLFDYL